MKIESFSPIQTNAMPRKDKILNLVWSMINSTLFRFTPPHLTFFRKLRTQMLKLFGARIDMSASVHPRSKIEYPWNLTMGELSSLGEGSWIYCMAPVSIGRKSCIGKNVYLLTGSHDISSPHFSLVTKPIIIGDGVWLTTNVSVLPGVAIGDFAVVSVDSVVAKNVDSWTVVGGNPAKFIKNREIKNA